MKCVMCGETLFGPYLGSSDYYSRPSTHLWDIPVYKCKCGENEISIPQIAKLDELLTRHPTVENVRWSGSEWTLHDIKEQSAKLAEKSS